MIASLPQQDKKTRRERAMKEKILKIISHIETYEI